MWNFLMDNLNPGNPAAGSINYEAPLYGLSTDLEEATDFGNLQLASDIFVIII